jgi:hypothetical protein
MSGTSCARPTGYFNDRCSVGGRSGKSAALPDNRLPVGHVLCPTYGLIEDRYRYRIRRCRSPLAGDNLLNRWQARF